MELDVAPRATILAQIPVKNRAEKANRVSS